MKLPKLPPIPPRSKVRFQQVVFRDDGLLVALDTAGFLWICHNMALGEWERLKHPEFEIQPTPTPTAGQPIRKF